MIETSLCITSYNRPKRLEEVLKSFFMTNMYDLNKLELIIVDNGSTDTSVTDLIKSYSPECEYRYILNKKNDYPNCLRYSKIQAREIAKGSFFIDCPDDHLFVARVPWIEQCIDRIKTDPTVGCIAYYAFPSYRFEKENNKMSVDKNNPEFCVSHFKGYNDFHIMSRETYEKIGPFKYNLGRKAEGEYMERSLQAGFFRNLLMKPVAICMDDGKFGEGTYGFEILSPIEKDCYENKLLPKFRKAFPKGIHHKMPIHNEALVSFCMAGEDKQRIRPKNE